MSSLVVFNQKNSVLNNTVHGFAKKTVEKVVSTGWESFSTVRLLKQVSIALWDNHYRNGIRSEVPRLIKRICKIHRYTSRSRNRAEGHCCIC